MPKSKYIKRKTSVDKNNLIKRNTDVIEEEIEQTGNDKRVFVSIKNIQHQYQCFSSWNKNDMNKFWAFNEKVHNMTWAQIFKTGGKNKKTGIACTTIPRDRYKNIPFIKSLSKDISMIELRIDNKIRVHGFRINSVFYLCVLDKNHDITK